METVKTTDKLKHFTGIGSLPHHNVDTALDFSFKMGIPFLPQIPIRNPWEFMIAQALEGLPGLQVEEGGEVQLNVDVWESQSHRLDQRLRTAFSQGPGKKEAFESFEPSAAISSCWQPFLWELQEKDLKVAKIQIAGPLTCQWGLKLRNGQSPDKYPELSSQIFRLVLARAMAMTHRMILLGIEPILYLDEPGLYALDPSHPKHLLCLQELRLMVQTLRKEGAQVGLHCCSNTHWESIFNLGIDYLSIDTSVSLGQALKASQGIALKEFIESGGKLSLGIIPTTRSSVLHSLDTRELTQGLLEDLHSWYPQPEFIKKILREAIFTPACGLALQSTSDAELILEKLVEIYEYFATA
jgi:methionine synthase II (cobalamin-independent)